MKIGDLVKTVPEYSIDSETLDAEGVGIILNLEWSKFFGFELITVLWSSGNIYMLPTSNFVLMAEVNA